MNAETVRHGPGVRVRAHVLDAVADHARAEWPDECCGLLLGTSSLIESVHRAANLRKSPSRYLVDPRDHFAAIRLARTLQLDVVGAYHSHPAGQPVPSGSDLAEALGGGFIYLIAGIGSVDETVGATDRPLAAPHDATPCRAAAWQLVDGNFVRLRLVRLA